MTSYIILGILMLLLIFIFSRFRPAATQKITDGLYAVRCGFVNFYAVNCEDGVILLDTGMNAALAKRGLKKLGISPGNVTHIFLTHTDYDHTGGITAFPKASVYISKDEEQMISGQTARRGFIRNRRLPSYHTMKDGEIVFAGSKSVKLYLTPGHTPGSSVYSVDGRILVTGDLLRLAKSGSVKPFFRLMNMNHRQDIQSIEAMRALTGSPEYILTGHTGVYVKTV